MPEALPIPPFRSALSHRVACVVAILVAILLTLYAGILRDLARQWWDDPNYGHGFLVPLFSGFVFWQRGERLRGLVPGGATAGLPVMLSGVALLLVGDLANENLLMRGSLIVVIAGLVVFHVGWPALRAVLFPLAFLVFMIPLPAIVLYAVTFPLQGLAAREAASLLDLLGVPVLLDGNVIHLSHLSLGVTEACSGIRSLISLLAGAAAWAYLMMPRSWLALVFVGSAVPITIGANVGRVVATGLIGQWFGVDYASGFFHELAGWVVYAFAFLSLVGVQGVVRLAMRLSSKPPT